jgi:hypothetical protein
MTDSALSIKERKMSEVGSVYGGTGFISGDDTPFKRIITSK